MKVFLGIFLLVVCVIVFGNIYLTQSTHGQKEKQIQKHQKEQIDEPTSVQKGRVTEKDREYSKEYKKLYSYRNGRKLTEMSESAKRKGNKHELGVSLGIPSVPTIGEPPTALEILRDLSCKADAIVLGSVQSKSAHLTEDETFVYTEYEFLVKDILKNNSASPIEINNNIQITRPGGLIKLDDQIIRVEDKLYQPLRMKKEYLLFLAFIPSANGYIVSDAKGDFVLENDSFKSLSRLGLPRELSSSESQALLNNVRNFVSTDCNQISKGGS